MTEHKVNDTTLNDLEDDILALRNEGNIAVMLVEDLHDNITTLRQIGYTMALDIDALVHQVYAISKRADALHRLTGF